MTLLARLHPEAHFGVTQGSQVVTWISYKKKHTETKHLKKTKLYAYSFFLMSPNHSETDPNGDKRTFAAIHQR